MNVPAALVSVAPHLLQCPEEYLEASLYGVGELHEDIMEPHALIV
jgi:hypothetical protein